MSSLGRSSAFSPGNLPPRWFLESWSRFVHHHGFSRADRRGGQAARRRSEPGGSTLLDSAVQARDASGQFLDVEEIQDHLFTMLIVGVDPVAIAFCGRFTGFILTPWF